MLGIKGSEWNVDIPYNSSMRFMSISPFCNKETAASKREITHLGPHK